MYQRCNDLLRSSKDIADPVIKSKALQFFCWTRTGRNRNLRDLHSIYERTLIEQASTVVDNQLIEQLPVALAKACECLISFRRTAELPSSRPFGDKSQLGQRQIYQILQLINLVDQKYAAGTSLDHLRIEAILPLGRPVFRWYHRSFAILQVDGFVSK